MWVRGVEGWKLQASERFFVCMQILIPASRLVIYSITSSLLCRLHLDWAPDWLLFPRRTFLAHGSSRHNVFFYGFTPIVHYSHACVSSVCVKRSA